MDKIINTHCHHGRDEQFGQVDLDFILRSSYVGWAGVDFDSSSESREQYLEKVRFKSYFKWLEKSLMELYGMGEPISSRNWNEYSSRIKSAHSVGNRHMELLTRDCGYEQIIQDAWWHPGDDNGHPDIFNPAFRIDPFLFAWDVNFKNHDGWSFSDFFSLETDDPEELVRLAAEEISRRKASGAVALKSAVAYERGIDFEQATREQAATALKKGSGASPGEVKAFQDYMFREICRLAGEKDIPFQVHTGLGQLDRTNPMRLKPLVEEFDKTKFVIFHGGYPWIQDTMALLHNYPNVYPDLCWMPLLSMKAAEIALHQYIEVGLSDRVCWGCDTWTGEESYGARLAFIELLNKVLGDKVDDRYLSERDAEILRSNFMYKNARSLYGFERKEKETI